LTKAESKDFKAKYAAALVGRPNIYIMFLYKCLNVHLAEGGYLAFIIPTSLYNCSYYQPMRDYLALNTTIHYVETLNKPGFYETGQETMLLIVQKTRVKAHDNYVFRANYGNIYISPSYKELRRLSAGTTTIAALGLGVKTGNVVWNQVKKNLSDSGTLLIYSCNIQKCTLTLNNLRGEEKKQYVTGLEKETLNGPVILVDRGYGNGLSFNYVLVKEKNFYAENHVNVIYPKTAERVGALDAVMKSFQDPRTFEFMKAFNGNGMVSASDIETIIPIWLD
jgi:adenine-specific DNA-methyltransferase